MKRVLVGLLAGVLLTLPVGLRADEADTSEAVDWMREARRLHVYWAKEVKRRPRYARFAGPPEWHRMWIRRYTVVIRLLETE